MPFGKIRPKTLMRILSLNTASIPILFSSPNTDLKYSVFWRFVNPSTSIVEVGDLQL